MNNKILSHHLQPLHRPIRNDVTGKAVQKSFQSILSETLDNSSELKISKHAEQRMTDRGITISNEMWDSIHSKVLEAKQKGIGDSVVVTKNAALIINAKNETVITAMDREEAESQIFTNISGTILME
ncbi:flagellar operon protein [Evansella caseinilytica]|uniref:Flagellar operon protein n=1 Tax=Evansella caseinilytica TaxID=1503961 RepID=A0A1H3M6K5_9BACI|nr:TIGR02530 family flagellar biosynthesis protein [Evansella caseinilytica]SDY71934.1 flagellar operon protein [Evansella caseinilytica]